MSANDKPHSPSGPGAAGLWLVWAGVLGFVGVGAGAFGAHGLRPLLTERLLAVYQTAVQYQLIHALALGLVAFLIVLGMGGSWPRRAGFCFAGGVILFSGSLYLLSLTGVGWLGAVTPLGGLLFLAGWICVVMAGLVSRRQ